jgi:hypothetical protein
MAYGIGSILGDIDQKADAYRNNPDALAQSYQQNQQLIDLLVLQKLKTDKEAAQRDMQAKMQTPAATIKDQRAQEVMGMTRNEISQQVAPGLQALGQQMQAAQAQPQGIASVPAPNMQQVGMAGGGIIAFADGDLVRKKAKVNKADITTPQGVEDLLAQAMGTNTDVPAGYRPVNEEGRMAASPLTDVPADYRPVRPVRPVQPVQPTSTVLGTRLNNPLNIRASDNNDWEGKTTPSGGFEGFNSIGAGLRAADINLRNYGKKYGIETIRGIINRWAPSSENKTEEYLSSVAKEFGVSPDDKVDLNDPGIRAKLISIMGQMETGVKNTVDEVRNYIAETTSKNQQEERENNARLRAQEAAGTYAERQAEHLVNTSEPFMHMFGANVDSGEGTTPPPKYPFNYLYGANVDPSLDYLRMMEDPSIVTPQRETDSEYARRMGLIPKVTPPATTPVPAPVSTGGLGPNYDTPYNGISSLLDTKKEDKTEAVLKVPTEAVKRAPSAAQQSYTQQLADLRVEQESKLESLIAFLKGAGGQSSFAATMMGGSDAMNAREAEVKAEIMDVLGKLEAIDMKEQEFDIEGRKIAVGEEGNIIAREGQNLANAQYFAKLASEEAQNLANNKAEMEQLLQTYKNDLGKIDAQEAYDFNQMETQEQLKFIAQTVESVGDSLEYQTMLSTIEQENYTPIERKAAIKRGLNELVKLRLQAGGVSDSGGTESTNSFPLGTLTGE